MSNSVLVYRLGSLGDTVVALPCFHLIARKFPDARRILLTNVPVHAKAPAAAAVLGKSGLIHDYISYGVGTRHPLNLAKLCFQIRRLKARTLVYLAPWRGESVARRDERFFRLCGIKEIIGLPLGDLAANLYEPARDLYEPEASRLARCIALLGDARVSDRANWNLLLTEEEKEQASEVLRPLHSAPFLVFGIGSKRSVTDWGAENWKALMPRLRRAFPRHSLVFIGAREDHVLSEGVGRGWPGEFLNLSGALSPRQSAAVIARADLFLGPDSGPMHLAASVGTPCVAIFSARNSPGIWFPFGDIHSVLYRKTECFGCHLDDCLVEKKKCILSISVDDVVRAATHAASLRAESIALRT